MDDLLMKKNEQVRFVILKKLLLNTLGVSIDYLATDFDLSIPTIYRHLNHLKKDLVQVFPDKNIQLIQNGSLLSIDYQNINLIYLIDLMHIHYIKTSPRFTVIQATLSKVYPSIESLAQELHLSTSYTYKTVAIFNEFLEQFDLKIKFNLFQARSSVDGNEINVRLYLFFSQWMLFKGINMPLQTALSDFYTIDFPLKHQLSTLNQVTQLTHYQVITYYRIVAKKNGIQLSQEFFNYLVLFESISPTTFPTEIIHALDRNYFSDSDLKGEEAFFGFATRFFIAGIDTQNTKEAISEKLMGSGLPLTTFIEEFLNKFILTFNLIVTREDYLITYYFLSLQFLYHQFVGIDLTVLDPSTNVRTMFDPLETERLSQFLDKNLNASIIKEESKHSLLTHCGEVLYSILKKKKKEKLTLFIRYSRGVYLDNFIKNNLSLVFSGKSIEFTEVLDEADLFISDIFEEVKEHQGIFYFENPYDKDTWHELILFISDRLF